MSRNDLTWVLITARVIYSAGIMPLLLFTCDVFRDGSRWANALVWANALALFSGVFFSTLDGDIEGLDVSSVWFWCEWIGYTATEVWPRWGDYSSGGLEAAGTLVLWFVFFPPAFYRHWVNRAANAPSNAAN